MKAIVLISGGLDSTLAAKLTKDLGLELIALNTRTPFCLCNHRSSQGCFHGAASVAKDLGLKLVTINVANEFLDLVRNPKHGYGSNMNPCIDCRILLFKKAKELMLEENASFVITGEVLGQRPMSQKLNTMRLIERESGLEGLVLRPLSAGVLEPTFAEKQNWILRDKLLSISGRGRREQIALANKFGVNDYPCPSGGCLLTDPEFAKRLKDLMRHQKLNLKDVELLKLGRHFRLAPGAKLVVGRNEKEDNILLNLAQAEDYLFMPPDELAGATSLGRGEFSEETIRMACSITCRYCDRNGADTVDIVYNKFPAHEKKALKSSPIEEVKLVRFRI